jgi:hypothetical protein
MRVPCSDDDLLIKKPGYGLWPGEFFELLNPSDEFTLL